MGNDTAGIINEGKELGLPRSLAVFHVRTKHRVKLPYLVGILLGESEPSFVLGLRCWGEQVILSNQPEEACLGACLVGENAPFNTTAVDHHLVVALISKLAEDLLNGFSQLFRTDLAMLALVRTWSVLEKLYAALLVEREPGLNCTPGKDTGTPSSS